MQATKPAFPPTAAAQALQALLDELRHRGVRLERCGDQLQVVAPPGSLTPALQQALAQHKSALLALMPGATAQRSGAAPPAATPAPEDAPFPLTPLQHAYWTGRQSGIEMGGIGTHFYAEFEVSGFDVAQLEQAWNRTVARHPMLRALIDEQGRQRVLADWPAVRIAALDLSNASTADSAVALEEVREQLSHQLFPADRWPLFELRASLLAGGRTRLHVSLDMLFLDGASISLLLADWGRLLGGKALPPPPAASFRDHVLATLQADGTGRGDQARRYWAARVPDLPGPPELPLRADASKRSAPRFTRRETRLEPARWQQLQQRASSQGLLPNALLMAVYAETLACWSTQAHFCLNIAGSQRARFGGFESVVGNFTSPLLLVVDRRDSGRGFADAARALQAQLARDMDHAQLCGVEVLRDWARHHGRNAGDALMPVVFSGGVGGPGAPAHPFGRRVCGVSQTSQVWLHLYVAEETDGALVLAWDSADEVLAEGVAEALCAAQAALIDRLADEPAAWAEPRPVHLPAAMAACRAAPPTDDAPAAAPRCLHAPLLAQARATPTAPAVLTPERTLSFEQLVTEAAGVARWLRDQGLQPGQPVAIVMRKGWQQVVAACGALMAGGAYLPIDADLPALRQRELLDIAGARHVLAQPGTTPPEGDSPLSALELRPGLGADAALLDAPPPSPHGLAYVIFTSGTTGVPKGVMIEHAAAANTLDALVRRLALAPSDRVLGVSSLSFDLSVFDIFGVLGAGGALVLPAAERAQDPAHWAALAAEHGVSVWNSAPQLMQMLLDHADAHAGTGAATPPPLRHALLSGDFIPLDLPGRVRRRFDRAEVLSLGGATEASVWSIAHPVHAIDPAWTSIPYGRALPGQTVQVLDAALHERPDQAVGRIFIGGAGLARGYWNDPALTAARFIRHPRSGARLYDTGDIGRYAPGGDIIIIGRADAQLKVRGHRIEPGEIEAVLCRHPAVRQAAVFATPAPQRQLVACVVVDEAADLSSITAHAAQRLPAYMLPQRLVPLPALPLSANGKVDHRALAALALQPPPAAAPFAPRDDIEARLHAIWSALLPDTPIGPDDNFFELGGDSVLATQLLRELNAALPFRLEMHELFEHLSIGALAALARERSGHPASDLPASSADATLAPEARLVADAQALSSAVAALPRPQHAASTTPEQVLLTGATGWVGAHMLAALLRGTSVTVHCLVRAADAHSARERVLAGLRACRLALAPRQLDRIQVWCGRLDAPRLGLDAAAWAVLGREVDTIFHLAGNTAVMQDYAALHRHNAAPLAELLALATQDRAKPLHVLSPGTVLRRRRDDGLHVLAGDRIHAEPKGLLTGYAQSKWVAEQALQAAIDRGLVVRLYRCARALPAASTGLAKVGDACQVVLSVAVQAGTLPDWPAARIDGLPVDQLCRWMLADARQAVPHSAVVHVRPAEPWALGSVLRQSRLSGRPELRLEALENWLQRCASLAAAASDSAVGALAQRLFTRTARGSGVENLFGPALAAGQTGLPVSSLGLVTDPPLPGYWRRVFGAGLD